VKVVRIRGVLMVALVMWAPAAWGNIFGPQINPFELPPEEISGGQLQKLQIGIYWTHWQLPGYEQYGATVSRDTIGTPLFTADYFVTHNLSVGGWWNKIVADDNQTGRPGLPRKLADVDVVFWDAHATYYLPEKRAKGWSVQLGYSSLHYDVHFVPEVGGGNIVGTDRSVNLWITKTRGVGRRRASQRQPVYLYVSVGYIPSPSIGTTNLIFGGSVAITPHVDLTGSVWLNDLEKVSVRSSVGLVGRF
jgi:hypothetical protein